MSLIFPPDLSSQGSQGRTAADLSQNPATSPASASCTQPPLLVLSNAAAFDERGERIFEVMQTAVSKPASTSPESMSSPVHNQRR
jgi:hypothetical protein